MVGALGAGERDGDDGGAGGATEGVRDERVVGGGGDDGDGDGTAEEEAGELEERNSMGFSHEGKKKDVRLRG